MRTSYGSIDEETLISTPRSSNMKRVVSTWWLKDTTNNEMDEENKISSTEEQIMVPPSPTTPTVPIHTCDNNEQDLFCSFLGFNKNPLISKDVSEQHVRNNSAADLRLSMLSNFSTAYNIVSISLALDMMEFVYDSLSASDRSLCSSALLAGMIFGQLGGGTLGDIVGRHVAMTIVMFLQITASFASAFSFDARSLQLPFTIPNIFGLSTFHVLAGTYS